MCQVPRLLRRPATNRVTAVRMGTCMVLSDKGSKEEEVLELRQDPRRLCKHRLVT